MDKNNSYFILSGFISLSLFALVLSMFMYMLFSSSKIKTFALKKDNYISISLEVVDIPTKKVQKPIVVPKEEIVSTPEVQEVKDVDINDLFSDVWTKEIKIKKKKPKPLNNKRLELIKKKIKTKDTSKQKQTHEEVVKNEAEVISQNNKKSTSGDEVNEYLAKIQAIVYKYFYPPNNSQGHSVRAVIKLSAIGKVMDFRILNYSANEALNEECDKIKDRLKGVLFPTNPQNRSSTTVVNITSDKN
jgi:protein TonB